VFGSRKVVSGKLLSKFFYVCLSLRELVNGKYFSVKRKFTLFPGKCFPEKFGRKTLSGVVKNLEMSYYLLIISNLVLKILIAIYILFWIFIFQFHLLKFNFYINFDPHFYNYYLFFPYHFLIEIFYLSNLVLILLIVTYFIWNNLSNVNYYYFNIFIFYFFYFLDLISINLIVTYFIWNNLWNVNYYYFNFFIFYFFIF